MSDLFGLICCATIAALILCSVLPKKARAAVLPVLLLVLFIPIPGTGCSTSAANILFALIDTPSLSLLIGSVFAALERKSPFKTAELAALVAVFLALAVTELGIIPYDLYGWGYRGDTAAALVCMGILFLSPSRWIILIAAYLLYRLGCYQNIFDTLVDPFLAISAAFVLIKRGINRALVPGRCEEVHESKPPTPSDR